MKVAEKYLEYLDVKDALKEIAEAESKAEQKAEEEKRRAAKRK